MSVTIMAAVFAANMPELKTDDGKTVPDSTAKFVLLSLADHLACIESSTLSLGFENGKRDPFPRAERNEHETY